MQKERSFGAVVYRINNGIIEYLIEEMNYGHISIPKGHIEKGETPLDTVHREIKEELNIEVEVDTNFEHTITYSPKANVSKDVTFYVAKPLTNDIVPQKEEVKRAYYTSFEEALNLITFESDKEVLIDANNYIERVIKKWNLYLGMSMD